MSLHYLSLLAATLLIEGPVYGWWMHRRQVRWPVALAVILAVNLISHPLAQWSYAEACRTLGDGWEWYCAHPWRRFYLVEAGVCVVEMCLLRLGLRVSWGQAALAAFAANLWSAHVGVLWSSLKN